MEDLKLPIIKNWRQADKVLSMDDYLKFVTFNLKYTVDIEAVRKQKREMAVDVPFRLC